MARNKGTFDFSANLEGRLAGPIDAKQLVGLKSDLISSTQWESNSGDTWTYVGMIVSVGADSSVNNGIYRLANADYTDINSWEKIGESDDLYAYIDGSLSIRDTRLDNIDTSILGLNQITQDNSINISNLDTSIADLDLLIQNNISNISILDNSVNNLSLNIINIDASIERIDVSLNNVVELGDIFESTIDVSMNELYLDINQMEASIGNLESSIGTLDNTKLNNTTDTFTGVLTLDGSITLLGDIDIGGNLTVNGSTYIVGTETIDVSSGYIHLNTGLTGTTPTTMQSGIVVGRGDLEPYVFLFDETYDTFRIGIAAESGGSYSDASTQAVATREDTPLDGAIAFWNNNEYRFDTSTRYIFGEAEGSVTLGYRTGTVGINSRVFGGTSLNMSTASGKASMTWGQGSTAAGSYSTAWGYNTSANGYNSTTWGGNTVADGNYSTAWGSQTDALVYGSTAWGDQTLANEEYATAWGYQSEAQGKYSTVWGYFTISNDFLETTFGRYNIIGDGSTDFWNSGDNLFTIGNGGSEGSRSNAFQIKKSGDTYIQGKLTLDGSTIIANNLKDASSNKVLFYNEGTGEITYADSSLAGSDTYIDGNNNEILISDGNGGTKTDASLSYNPANNSFTVGFRSGSVGIGSVLFGGASSLENIASGARSLVYGALNTASGTNSFAGGSNATASGGSSVALGATATASSYSSIALGTGANAHDYLEVALGTWNVVGNGNTTSWDPIDNLFTIGNGPNSSSRSTAFQIYKNADVSMAGKLFTSGLSADNSTNKVLFYNESTNEISYADASFGGGSGLGEEIFFSGTISQSSSENIIITNDTTNIEFSEIKIFYRHDSSIYYNSTSIILPDTSIIDNQYTVRSGDPEDYTVEYYNNSNILSLVFTASSEMSGSGSLIVRGTNLNKVS